MRNAKLWNDGIKDYLALFSNCSSIEMKYARFGKIKMLQWVKRLICKYTWSLYPYILFIRQFRCFESRLVLHPLTVLDQKFLKSVG